MDLARQLCQRTLQFLFIDEPVPQSAVIIIALSEPAVIQHEHFDTEFFCLTCDLQDLFLIKCKVGRFPVVDQDWSLLMKIFASDHVVSVEIMIASGHFSQTFMGINHNNFRCLEFFSFFQNPAEFFFVDTHNCTDRIKLV